jgi:hypothetical protein
MEDRIAFSWVLDTSGAGSGTKAANVDFTLTDWAGGTFSLLPGDGEIMAVTKLLVEIVDGGVMSADKYAGITALTTGVAIRVNSRRGVISDLTDGVLIKKNGDWARVASRLTITTFGSGDEALHAVLEFDQPIHLHGDRHERLEVVMPVEDMSDLSDQYFVAQGYYAQGGGSGRVTQSTTTSITSTASSSLSSSLTTSASSTASSSLTTTASTSETSSLTTTASSSLTTSASSSLTTTASTSASSTVTTP